VVASLRWSGYSFRRGGINEVYRAARANGAKGIALVSMLMGAGRWRSAASLHVYLVEVDPQLADVFRLVMSRAGIRVGAQGAEEDDDGDAPEAVSTGATDSSKKRKARSDKSNDAPAASRAAMAQFLAGANEKSG
jgi:hypothetical protein